jgi:effector-binding domain-containing protein
MGSCRRVSDAARQENQQPRVLGIAMILLRVIGFLLVATLILISVGFLLPAEVKVQREITVAAAPEEVFDRINNLREFNQWSPWTARDPKIKIVYSGPPAGPEAKMSWTSTIHGTGTQEIKESVPGQSVLYRIEWGGTDVVFSDIKLARQPDDTTKVTWSYKSELGNNPFKRYMALMYPSWISTDYELGLGRLKGAVEGTLDVASGPASPPELDTSKLPPDVEKALTDKEPQPSPIPSPAQIAADPDVAIVEAQPIVFVSTKAQGGDQAGFSAALGDANNALIEYILKHNLDASGAPLAISKQHEPEGTREFNAAIRLTSMPPGLPEEGKVQLGKTPGGKAIMMVHKGPQSTIDDTYAKLRAKIKEKGLKEGQFSWEEYVTDSNEVDESELLTNVFIQVE